MSAPKPLIDYRYRGHSIRVTESKRGPFVIEVGGPAFSMHQDTYSLDHLERVLEERIDRAIETDLPKCSDECRNFEGEMDGPHLEECPVTIAWRARQGKGAA